MKDICKAAGIAIENYPPGIIVDWVNGAWIAVNYSDQPHNLTGDKKREFIVGSSQLPVAGRAVWIE